MSEGIAVLRDMLKHGIAVVNAVDAFKHFDYNLALKQVMDLEESEILELAKDFEVLDLADDVLEAKAEAAVLAGAGPLAFIIRLLKIFLPKKP